MQPILIDAWNLKNPMTGLGVYAWRVVAAILRQAPLFGGRVTLALPHSLASADLSTRFGPALLTFFSPRTGSPLLDNILWQNLLGFYCRRRAELLFSPGPFWSLVVPRRTVITHHDCIPRIFPEYLGKRFVRGWLLRRQERFMLQYATVIAVSNSAREELLRRVGTPRAPVHVVHEWLPPEYNPANAAAQAARVRRKYALPESCFLYVGGYDLRKNVELLIAAYALAEANVACPPLVLAGEIPPSGRRGPFCDVRGAIRRCPPAVARKILTPGAIAPEDMPGLYGAAALLVYPSRHEGFGLPPLEAMGCGCPALAGDNSSLRELVVDREYRFAVTHPEPLAELLQRAAHARLPLNPGFRREQFDEVSAIEAYANIFNSVT